MPKSTRTFVEFMKALGHIFKTVGNSKFASCSLVYQYISGGVTTQRWPGSPAPRGFQITHNDALHSVGLLWTSYQLVAETST